jgi:hypothetical protein
MIHLLKRHLSLKKLRQLSRKILRLHYAVSGRNTFAPNHPLESGFGDSVYLDARSGPVPDFDPEYAVVGFRYEVVTDDQTVSYGQEDF